MQRLIPLGDRLVVRPLEAETTTASGLVIPDTAAEAPQHGEVIAVGPGRWEDGARRPLELSEGDRVLFARYRGSEVRIDGEDLLVLSDTDVLARVEEVH